MARRKHAAAVALALSAVLGASGVAIADDDDDGRPRTDRVEATIVFTHGKERHRFCEGEDGPYVEAHVVVDGVSTSPDPRLTGDVQLRLHLLLKFTGDGTERGTFVIRDSDTHKKKVTGEFFNADQEEISQGVIVGKVHAAGIGDERRGDDDDDDEQSGGKLTANWRITFHPGPTPEEPGPVTAQLGGAAEDGRLPAVIQSGQCTGRFETVEFDIPPPSAVAAARVAATSSVWVSRSR
jgi:hypothetical protein